MRQECDRASSRIIFQAETRPLPVVVRAHALLRKNSDTTTPPSINIHGSNPATINVGDTYTDLGAIVTDNQGHDLGYRTFLNGALVSNILIDTTQAAIGDN